MSVIAVFVASSFPDLQQERDVLRSRVAPRLSEMVAEWGARVEFIDLRWGAVDPGLSELERDAQVVELCRREIDRSRPLMLGIIGERYGDVLARDRYPLQEVAGLPTVVDDAVGRVSITEYELLYGLHATNDAKVMVLARQLKGAPPAEWQEGRERALALRKRLASTEGVTLRYYRAELRDDGTVDLAGFERDVLRLLRRPIVHLAREMAIGDRYADAERSLLEQQVDAVGLDDLVTEILTDLLAGGTAVIADEAVIGKTTLFARVVSTIRASGEKVASVSAGRGEVDSFPELIAVLSRQVRSGYIIKADDVRARLDRLVLQVDPDQSGVLLQSEANRFGEDLRMRAEEAGVRCVVIDGVDRLRGPTVERNLVWNMLSPIIESPHIGLLYICDRLPPGAEGFVRHLRPLEGRDAARMLDGLVMRSGRRGLPRRALEIVERSPRSPLWVRLAYESITGLGSEEIGSVVRASEDWSEGLAGLITAVLEALPDEDAGALHATIAGVSERMLGRDARSPAREVLEVLTAVPDGLSTTLIAELLETDYRRVSSTLYELWFLLEMSSTARSVRIAHRHVAEVLRRTLSQDRAAEVHRRITSTLTTRPRTAAESVTLIRSAFLSSDAATTQSVLSSDASRILESRVAEYDLLHVYIEALDLGRTLVPPHDLRGDGLLLMCRTVVRRLDGGRSFAPDDQELQFLNGLVERCIHDVQDSAELPLGPLVRLFKEVEIRFHRVREDVEGAKDQSLLNLHMMLAACKKLDATASASLEDVFAVAELVQKTLTGPRGMVLPEPSRILEAFNFIESEIEWRCIVSRERGTPPDSQWMRWRYLYWLQSMWTFEQLLASFSEDHPEAHEMIVELRALHKRADEFAEPYREDMTWQEVRAELDAVLALRESAAVSRPSRIDAPRSKIDGG